MLNRFKVITITHKEVPLKELSKYMLPATEGNALKVQLEQLVASTGIKELIYLTTCNRITYFFTSDHSISPAFLSSFFEAVNPMLVAEDLEHPTCYEGLNAIDHMSQVASSIDSMVVGEREILRQLRLAYQQCADWLVAGDDLRLAMKFLVATAKQVYSDTSIGEKPVSVVSLAIQQLLNAKLPKNARILLVGAGQTNALVSKFLLKYAFSNVTVFNRTIEKAEVLAEQLNGKALALDEIDYYKEGFDCMIVCTGVAEPIIRKERYASLLADETNKKLVIDLGIPHNVEEGLDQHFKLQYLSVEDLQDLAQVNLAFREREVLKAKNLIAEKLQSFEPILKQRQLEKALQSVPEQIKQLKAHTMDNVFKKEVEELDPEAQELVHRMLAYMEKKCISIPMKAAREAVIS